MKLIQIGCGFGYGVCPSLGRFLALVLNWLLELKDVESERSLPVLYIDVNQLLFVY